MIQLYNPSNTNFNTNGDMILSPLSCTVSAAINDTWGLELLHPIDAEGRWKSLVISAVLKVPSFNGEQLFRIVSTSKTDGGVTVKADPIFYDSGQDVFLLDSRPTNKTLKEALDILLAGTKYTGKSNITDKSTAYFINKNFMECLSGAENSLLERWGGEILFNNYEVIVNKQIGGDYGVSVLYGKNLPTDGVTEEVDYSTVVTRIVPKAYNGYMLDGTKPWVDSSLINSYPTVRTKVYEYSNLRLREDDTEDEEATYFNTLAELRAALRKAAAAEFTDGVDKPSVNLSIDMVLLENTEEYKGYKDLVKVSLGDTITCKNKRLGIDSTARVIGLTYDCIHKQVTNVEIGEAKQNFISQVASTVQSASKALTPGGNVVAGQIEGFIDGALAQLRLQNTVAKKQDVRAILFEDLDPASATYGALSIGTQGWQISKERTADDREWVWTTAGTAGGLIADVINTGTLEAIDIKGVNITGSTIKGNTISGGTLTGTEINNGNGTFKVDANGNLTATSATITGTITGSTISGGTISGATITTTGDIDYNDNTQGTITLKGGYFSGRVQDGTTIYAGALNGQYCEVAQFKNSVSTANGVSYAHITNRGRFEAEATTYGAMIGADNGIIQVHNKGNTNIKTIVMSAATGQITTRGTTQGNQIQLTPDTGRVMVGLPNNKQIAMDLTGQRFYIYDGSKYVWQSDYSTLGTVSYGYGIFAGHVTNSTKSLDFFVPLNISAEGRTASVTWSNNSLSARTISGYINNTQYLNTSAGTITTTCVRNGIWVRLTQSSAFTNVTNNTPVSVGGNISITFTK